MMPEECARRLDSDWLLLNSMRRIPSCDACRGNPPEMDLALDPVFIRVEEIVVVIPLLLGEASKFIS